MPEYRKYFCLLNLAIILIVTMKFLKQDLTKTEIIKRLRSNLNLSVFNKASFSTFSKTFSEQISNQSFIWQSPISCPPKMKFFNASEKMNYPKTALISYPSSGNGFTRDMLQITTGIYTGHVYHVKGNNGNEDFLEKANGFVGRGIQDSSVIAIKTHQIGDKQNFKRAILLTKNPYEAILSYWIRFKNKKKKKINETVEEYAKRLMNSTHWIEARNSGAQGWCHLHKYWLCDFKGALHLIHYEDLLENPIKEMAKVLRFLDFEVNEKQLNCLKNSTTHPKRTEGISTQLLLKHEPYLNFDNGTLEFCKQLVHKWPKIVKSEWSSFSSHSVKSFYFHSVGKLESRLVKENNYSLFNKIQQ